MLEQLGSTNGAAMALSWMFPPSHVSLLNRFWTGTALTPAIALGVAVAWSAARALHQPSRLAWLRTFALALAMFAIHPAYGMFAAAAVTAGLVAVAREGERRGTAVAALAAIAIAGIAGLLYVRLCSVPGIATPIRTGIYMRNVWSLLLAVGPWWLIAAPAFMTAWRTGVIGRFAVAAALSAIFAAVFVVLPEANSDKLFYLVWVSIAPLAAAGVVGWGERFRLPTIARVVIVAALIVPTAGLYVIGNAADRRSPGILIRGDAPATRQEPLVTGAEEGVYRYLREQTPSVAVVIEKPRPTVNEPVPVLAERRVFCGSLDVYLANHFGIHPRPSPDLQALLEEVRIRRDIQLALFSDGVLNEAQQIYLAGFSAPLYLLVRRGEVGDPVWTGFRGRPEWDEVIANEQVRLYQYVPNPLVVPPLPGSPTPAPEAAPEAAPHADVLRLRSGRPTS
jgi:hypothetical protein